VRNLLFAGSCLVAGFAIGTFGLFDSAGSAQEAPPSEHKGLTVETLGVIPEESVKATVGLDGRILLLRAITIEPGGQIAKHSHEKVPGLVKVVSGSWVEGRDAGETTFSAGGQDAIIEDESTVHWFYNRGDEPATAIVCDIKPAS
jgi:quercetin dioxygenase-like cupin family protein